MIKSISFLLFFSPFLLFTQLEKVDLKNFNAELLSSYLTKEVNNIRIRRKLDPLINDLILEKAALDQAKYMAEEDVIGHGQKSKKKGSPYKRVLFYGGAHNLIGENVQTFNIEAAIKKSKNRLTYEQLARDMIKVWKKSKEHNRNLMGTDFANIAHEFALKDGVLFACQVFGSKPFIESYEFQKGNPIRVKDGTECSNCRKVKEEFNNDEVSLGWYTVSNDSVYYWNRNHSIKRRFYLKKKGKYLINSKKDNLNKVFKAGGVIAIDIVHNEQFDCKGKESFHNSPYHNGYYIGSIDKSTAKSKDVHPSPEIIKVFIGMKPAFVDTFFQVDFQLVKKQKLCIQTSTIYVTTNYLKPSEFFSMPNPKISLDKNLIIEDSVSVRIPFKRNQTNQDTSIFLPLIAVMDSLVRDQHQIETIFFTGVASIEGTLKANRKLFIKRGKIIEDYLKRYYPEIPFQSDFYENFDDFRSALVAAGYIDVTEVSNDTLRIFANDNIDDKDIIKALDLSRFSTVKVVYRDYFPIEAGSYGLSVARIKDLMSENESDIQIPEIIPLYLVMANKAINGDDSLKKELLTLEFPKENAYAKLHWYRFLLELATTNIKVDAKRLNELKDVGAITSDADYLEFRLLFNLFYKNQAIDISDKNEILPIIRQKRQKAWVESLLLISQVENYETEADVATPILLNNVLKRKFELNETYFICQYLIKWGYTSEPYVLLSKFASRPGQNPKLYLQYLKLGYFLQQFENPREWKKIKVVIKNLAKDYPSEFCNLFKWNQMGVRSLGKEEIAKLFCEKCRDGD